MSVPTKGLTLSDAILQQLVTRSITCPFLGFAVAMRKLAVLNAADNPLANLDELRRLGNSGGGNLGDLLVFFARGNHALMRGAANTLDAAVPNDLFSLELPGSQGSHPGHSGILQGDPHQLHSGRFSRDDFKRLESRARDGQLKRSEVGRFIAENLRRDPDAKVAEASVAKLLAGDLVQAIVSAGALLPALFKSAEERDDAHREFEQKLTKLMGENNLAGSAGEFGLLFAFLDNSPHTSIVDDEPALSFEDVRAMFVHKRLPDGWENWKKTRRDWLRHTTALLKSALAEYRAQKHT
jgi:hypothetical protein